MRRSLVVGNWKMHGSTASVAGLVEGIKAGAGELPASVDVAVCPPAVFISQTAELLTDTAVNWGAQTLCEFEQGAYTGEVSADMLRDLGCRYVIIGHSERRSLFHESDSQIAAKLQAALQQQLTPILCVGESLQQREAGEALSWIESQLKAIVDEVGIAAFGQSVVAYEPIWAIGTGKTASPEQAQEVHGHIRQVMSGFDQQVAEGLRILYGGSVKPSNAAELFANQDIDGALVGGASLKAEDFLAIVKAA